MRLMRAVLAAACLGLTAIGAARAENITLRIASGHAPAAPYVHLMQTFFVPEVAKRVKARTKHTIEFIEGYGGAMVKVTDTLEGVQSGIIDIGGYCFCFEPSNLPLHAYQVMLPFSSMSAVVSGKVARAVYDRVPYMTKVFEDKFGQVLLGLVADNGFNLLTAFEWNALADLKGRKIAGAGLNLKWLEFVGSIPVQTSAPEVYTALQTGVFQGVLIPANFAVTLKWYEVAKTYSLTEQGAITWQGMTINKARFAKLPQEVQDILLEVGRDFETRMADINEADYLKQLEQMRSLGVNVRPVAADVKAEWARSLANWPQQKADELDAKGLPASQVLRLAVDEAERLGHTWPVRYVIKDRPSPAGKK